MIDRKIEKKVIISVLITIVLTILIAQVVFSYKIQTIEVNKKEYKTQDSVIYTEIWVENEISIDSVKAYNDPFNDVNINMILTNGNKTYNIPGFWDGGNNWKVRFVCTEIGEWSYFYLGDTHWSLGEEPVEMIREIVKKRKEHGFTVIQTEPLRENFSIYNGIDNGDIKGFKDLDQKFEIIANAGFVNANAEFFYPSNMEALIINFGGYNEDGTVSEKAKNYIEKITRYWVARYGAFPVIWTLGQEVDKDFYASNNNRKNWIENNPYKLVARYIEKYDPYNQPITAHQETFYITQVKNSCFLDEKEHKMWAAQWSPSITQNIDFSIPEEYWYSSKPSINYEGRYCYLWTKNFGSRAQGWISYLNGFYGYGYGAQDIWSYKNTYGENGNSSDGVDTITSEEKKAATWENSLEYPSAYQVGYMKNFFENIGEWESLIPRFDDKNYFVRDDGVYASIASNEENSKIVIYFYNFSNKSVGEKPNASTTGTKTGNLYNLIANHDYKYVWFNPINGEYSNIGHISSDSNGHITIPNKENTDMVFYLFDNCMTINGIEPGYEYVLTLDEYDKIKNNNKSIFENSNISSNYTHTTKKCPSIYKILQVTIMKEQ